MLIIRVTAQKADYSGRVTDELGLPLNAATILLEPDRHTAFTDDKGYFIFRNIYTGQYILSVTHTGYKPYTATISITDAVGQHKKIILQKDSSSLQRVTVTAQAGNSSPDNLIDVQGGAMPVTVITRQMIEKMGSRRLDEVLKEQTGIAIVNELSGGARATGIQLQGFDSEYVMVLIDGQPMTGRNSGNFDLSRISVTNIERIEIVKGASSCMFGSDALGGAINIITRHGVVQPQALASLQYGSLNIIDATVEGETPFRHNRGSLNLAANYYHSDGYNTDPLYVTRGTTAPPYDDYSVQARTRYRLTEKGTIGGSARFALRRSYMEKVFSTGEAAASGDRQNISDVNVSVYYNHQYNTRLQNNTRYYLTRYASEMSVAQTAGATANLAYEQFTQTVQRLEQQWAYQASDILKLTGGAGAGTEHLNSTDFSNGKPIITYFGYLQADWKLTALTDITSGVRYDGTNYFGGSFNPSLGLQQRLGSKLYFKLAAGTGFKAPDFKTRYQVFINPAANYMVIGTEVLRPALQQMQERNEISEIRNYVLQQVAGNLQPERSVSLNASLTFKPSAQFKWELGGFYHSLRNQINSIQVATGIGNRLIFTYQNLPRSFNTGIETSFSYTPVYGLEVNGGYQYLVAKDRSVKDSILQGNYPWYKVRNNSTGETFDSKPAHYWGLENRSRHMANLRVFYKWDKPGLTMSLRANYRGRYPFGDANNNNFIDRYDQFVNGYLLLNASVEKKMLKDHLSLRLTADNLLDYTDRLIPGQPGRIILLGISYRLYKN